MKKFFQNNKFHILSVSIIFALFLAYNYKLLLDLSSTLTDWYDYPLMVYIIQENVKHLMNFDFANLGNFSIYYPTPNGMYFTDLLLPQSIFALFIYSLSKNFIVTHNLVFLFVGLLNIISLQYLWSKIFKDKRVASLLSLLFTFSPYTLNMQIAHYQMISYWFTFFSLGILIDSKENKQIFLAGLLSGLQFLAAVYLGIYSLTISGIFFIWKIFSIKSLKEYLNKNIVKTINELIYPKKTKKYVVQGLIFILGFVLVSGYFIYQFAYTKDLYQITRSADDYVNHSIQVTDFFFNPMPSLWVEGFYKNINVHNHRLGGETFGTGFVLIGLFIFGVYQLLKNKKLRSKSTYLTLMILLLSWGFIAMIGPRLAINGKYLGIPLPYIFSLKFTPIFDALRVVSRWFFVFQIGLLYFVGISFKQIVKGLSSRKSFLVVGSILILYAIEIVPVKQRTTVNTYQTQAYQPLSENCVSDDVLLEYPFSPQNPGTHILVSLEYWTKMLLNNMHYECQLVNGYSGFQPKHIDNYYHNFRNAFETKDLDQVDNLLKEKDVRFIKFNKEMMVEDSIYKLTDLTKTDNFEIIVNDSEYLVLEYIR